MERIKHFTGRLATIFAALLLGGLGVTLTACNTTEGVGEDVEAAGSAIQDAAD
jgi:entericidin B